MSEYGKYASAERVALLQDKAKRLTEEAQDSQRLAAEARGHSEEVSSWHCRAHEAPSRIHARTHCANASFDWLDNLRGAVRAALMLMRCAGGNQRPQAQINTLYCDAVLFICNQEY